MAEWYVSSLATGSGTGTSASPWTLDQSAAANGQASGDRVNIKADGTYNRTAVLQLAVAALRYEGYTSTIGDGGRPTITTSTNSVDLIRLLNGIGHVSLVNLIIGSTAASPGDAIRASATGGYNAYCLVQGCKLSGVRYGISGDYAVDYDFNSLILDTVEITGWTAHAIINSGGTILDHCYIHDGTGDGVYCGAAGSMGSAGGVLFDLDDTTIARVTGAGLNDAYSAANPRTILIEESRIDSNTGDGIKIQAASGQLNLKLENNYIFGNGGYGVNCTAAMPLVAVIRNNAYGSNTSGDRNNVAAGANDITGISNPWTSSSTGNYAPKSTAAGKAAGYPGVGLSGTGYLDIGGIQHQDSGGTSGGLITSREMGGGYSS